MRFWRKYVRKKKKKKKKRQFQKIRQVITIFPKMKIFNRYFKK